MYAFYHLTLSLFDFWKENSDFSWTEIEPSNCNSFSLNLGEQELAHSVTQDRNSIHCHNL